VLPTPLTPHTTRLSLSPEKTHARRQQQILDPAQGIGGVAGTVIAAVLIYYFTRPAPVTPPPPTVSFEGLVSNGVTHDPVANASVTVSIGSNSVQQNTDMEGRYSVVLNGTTAADMGTVAIQAPGYDPYSNTVALTSGENFTEIPIEPVPPAAPGQPPRIVPTNKPKPIILKTPPTSYTRKKDIAYQANFKK
jgi:hypothetical protein